MFNSITWGQYFTTVTLLLICYYVLIGFRYYCWEILSVIGIKKVEDNTITKSTVSNLNKPIQAERHEDYLAEATTEIDISPVVQSFTDEIKNHLQGLDADISKSELLQSIQAIVLKYPVLKNVDYKHELIQFIIDESNALHPSLLQPNDVKQLLN